MDYRQAIAYVIQRSGYDRGFVSNPFDAETVGLRRTAWLLEALGTPQSRYPILHVAGTKGKGSTAAMLAAIQRSAGRRVGLYTSPHLHTFRERIQLDGEPISEEAFAALTDELARTNARLGEARPEWGEGTSFEVVTALALLAFARAGVDLAVVEVGLGGRLDATNVVLPEVAVITPVSLDHTGILGDTLAQIAGEKGGIIKSERPVVAAPQQPEAAAVLASIAAERHAPLFLGGRDWQVEGTADDFAVQGPWASHAALRLALRGRHQVENAGTAVVACGALATRGIATGEAAIRRGLASVRWAGRFEIIRHEQTLVLDGAHNLDSAERLAQALRDEFPGRHVSFVLGVARDKDVEGIVATLAPLASRLYATASHNPRAAQPGRITQAALAAGLAAAQVVTLPTVAEALARARVESPAGDVICVTGSLYAVAEAREALGLARSDPFEQELLYR